MHVWWLNLRIKPKKQCNDFIQRCTHGSWISEMTELTPHYYYCFYIFFLSNVLLFLLLFYFSTSVFYFFQAIYDEVQVRLGYIGRTIAVVIVFIATYQIVTQLHLKFYIFTYLNCLRSRSLLRIFVVEKF